MFIHWFSYHDIFSPFHNYDFLGVQFGFSSESYTVNEGEGQITLQITKQGTSDKETLIVLFQTVNGTALGKIARCNQVLDVTL